jgi:hypothetical protein
MKIKSLQIFFYNNMIMYIKIDLKKNSPSYEQFIIQYQLLILN